MRHGTPLSLVLFDIDHFKKVNDTHGHQAGDDVLSEISTLLTDAMRAEDVFARYGGEEFAVICRGSDVAQAQVVGERCARRSRRTGSIYDGTHIPVTISVGVAGAARTPPSRTPTSSCASPTRRSTSRRTPAATASRCTSPRERGLGPAGPPLFEGEPARRQFLPGFFCRWA